MEDQLGYLCRHFMLLLQLPIRRCRTDGSLLAVYGGGEVCIDPVQCDQALCTQLCTAAAAQDFPVLLFEEQSLLYASVPLSSGCLLLGPVLLSPETFRTKDYARFAKRHSLEETRAGYLPAFPLVSFVSAVCLLFHALGGAPVSVSELLLQNQVDGHFQEDEIESEYTRLLFERREDELPHTPYAREQVLIRSIQSGDPAALHQNDTLYYIGTEGRLSDNELTHQKNMCICTVTLATRAAIEGGVLPETAYGYSDAFIRKVEHLQTPAEVAALSEKALLKFTNLVGEARRTQSASLPISRCKDYIYKHLHQPLTVEQLAEAAGVHKDYLSRLFRRCEGISITRYIRRERIQEACNLLRYSDYPLARISEYLGFASQSYFTAVFREQLGSTPQQYRAEHGNAMERNSR